MKLQYPEFADNPENRCPVVLLLDTSASMEGPPMDALNQGMATFKYDVEQDPMAALRVELAIVTFGQDVLVQQEFVTIDEYTPRQLTVSGKTPMGMAMQKGWDLLEDRKKIYRSQGIQYYRPWIFLITDGAPTDETHWPQAARVLQEADAKGKVLFFVIAVEGADMDVLKQIAPKNRPPIQMKDLKFNALFRWISTSVRRVSVGRVGSDMCALPPVSSWAV